MSTLTPNYGLHLPENTDSMDDFFDNYESDMTTIDDHLGSGGGATIEEMTQAEYEALPDTKLTDGILRGLKDVKSFLDADILYLGTCYSTSERMVGCWIDGKPLYKRTWKFNSTIIINADTWTSLGISGGDMENIIFSETVDDEGRTNKVAYCGVRNSYVSIYSTFATNVLTVTLYYTKSTDVAGSGTWTPSGVNAVHYDDTEKIIGTWFGETLYEKTISLTSGIDIGSYGHISLPANSIVRGLDGYAYRNSHASVDRFNGFINSGDLYASIRSGQIEYWISNIFSPVEEITFTIQYTKSS